MKTQPDELVFVVRMWMHGDDSGQGPEWRGAVHDVRSGQRYYAAGTRDIADFIDARIAAETKPER